MFISAMQSIVPSKAQSWPWRPRANPGLLDQGYWLLILELILQIPQPSRCCRIQHDKVYGAKHCPKALTLSRALCLIPHGQGTSSGLPLGPLVVPYLCSSAGYTVITTVWLPVQPWRKFPWETKILTLNSAQIITAKNTETQRSCRVLQDIQVIWGSGCTLLGLTGVDCLPQISHIFLPDN